MREGRGLSEATEGAGGGEGRQIFRTGGAIQAVSGRSFGKKWGVWWWGWRLEVPWRSAAWEVAGLASGSQPSLSTRWTVRVWRPLNPLRVGVDSRTLSPGETMLARGWGE